MNGDPIWTSQEVEAAYPFLKRGWLERKRCSGGGPPFIRAGKKVGYRRSDIEEWLDQNRRTTTSDPGPNAEAAPRPPRRLIPERRSERQSDDGAPRELECAEASS